MTNTMTGQQAETTTVGPVDFLALEFPGNRFNGEIMRNLYELVAAGTIRIIDLVVVTKSQVGSVATMELHEVGGEASAVLAPLQATVSEIITRDDINAIVNELTTTTTAAILVYENLWAVKTMQAMLDADGRMLAFQRIPHQVIVEALQDVAAMRVAAA